MPEDLYQAVRAHAGGKPFSTTMCDLIRQAFGLEVIPDNNGTTEISIYEQLKALTARVDKIEPRIVVPEVVPKVIPEKEPQTPLDHHQITQGSQENEHPAPANQDTDLSSDDWVMITDEIRAHLVDHLSKLQAGGMSYSKIGTLVGMGKGRFTELHQGKMKKMRRSQYEALLQLQ